MKTKSILAGLLMAATSLVNAQTWNAIGDQVDMNGYINDLTIAPNNNIYVYGYTRYGNTSAYQVMKWNFVEWLPVGNIGVNNRVDKMAIDNSGNIYVIGYFTDVTNKYFVMKWNGTTWSPLGTLKSTTVFKDIITDGTNIYVAGVFTNPNNGETCYVNKWNGTNWTVMPDTNFNGAVNSLDLDENNNLVVAGEIKNALNYYGVFRLANGISTEIGKIRSASIIRKAAYNKANGQVLASITTTDAYAEPAFYYNPSNNTWTAISTNGFISEFQKTNYFIAPSVNSVSVGNTSAGTTTIIGEPPISNHNLNKTSSCKFDGFGYAVCATTEGKVFRYSQKIYTPLATSETTAKSKITIYPNPSTGIVNISNKEKISSLEVYDAAGKLLQKAQPNIDKTQIDLSGKKGVYLIKATSNSGSDAQNVIIK